MVAQNGLGLLELVIVEVENVDPPGTAQFDVGDTQLIEYGTLLFEIVIDFVSESG